MITEETHRNSEKVELDDVHAFLADMGYKPEKLSQPSRHVIGTVTADGKRLFFKLASSVDVAPRTANEIEWYERLDPILDELPEPPFRIPKVIQHGVWQNLPFFISEEVPGKALSDRPRIERVTGSALIHITQVAKACAFILRANIAMMPRDRSLRDRPSDPGMYRKRVISWSEESGSNLAEKLVPLALRWLASKVVAPCHGDFTLDHIFTEGNDVWLVDAEAASAEAPLFYDAAYFYHRAYTKYQSPQIAETFRASFQNLLTEDEQKLFDRHFYQVLALRLIGGWRDQQHDGTDRKYHEELSELLLQ